MTPAAVTAALLALFTLGPVLALIVAAPFVDWAHDRTEAMLGRKPVARTTDQDQEL